MDGQHIVGGVACGGEGATSSTGLVYRAGIAGLLFELAHFTRNKPDLGMQVKEVWASLKMSLLAREHGTHN